MEPGSVILDEQVADDYVHDRVRGRLVAPVVTQSVQDQTDVRRPLRAADDHVSQVVIRILTVEQVVVADLMAPWLSGERDAKPGARNSSRGTSVYVAVVGSNHDVADESCAVEELCVLDRHLQRPEVGAAVGAPAPGGMVLPEGAVEHLDRQAPPAAVRMADLVAGRVERAERRAGAVDILVAAVEHESAA